MPYEPEHAALTKARRMAEAVASWDQQFGQSDDSYAWDGGAACTHALVQYFEMLVHGRHRSINEISRLAGYPYHAKNALGQPRGLNSVELQRVFDALNLPWVIRFGLSFQTMHSYTSRGPVFLAVRHGSIPEQLGYTYFGTRADGKPNGYARKNGRTQLTGFENGAHAVADLGSRRFLSDATTVDVTCDTRIIRSPSIKGETLGTVAKGDTVKVTDTVAGGHWSGCGREGTRWHKVTVVNGKSTRTLYGRAYGYIAERLVEEAGVEVVRTDLWSKDPNHNSGSRPENPPYDIITKSQAAKMYNDHHNVLGRLLYGAIPTRSLV